MSRTILFVFGSAVTVGLIAVFVTAVHLEQGESAVGAGSPATVPQDQRAGPIAARTQEGTVVSQSKQVLVLLPEASASEYVGRLQSAYRVLTMLRPRIVVVDVDEPALTALRATPGVAGVYEQKVPAEVLAGLTTEERLFVEGWIQQQASKDKSRSGDGLSWDAPGFKPPGPPVKKP
jgi:hypothetical protein